MKRRILLAFLCVLTLFAVCQCSPDSYEDIVSSTREIASLPAEASAAAASDPVSTTSPLSKLSPSPSLAPIPTTPSLIRINVLAAGDIMCLYSQLNAARKNKEYQFDYSFGEIKAKVTAADLAIGNLESLAAEGYPLTGRSPSVGNPKLNAPEAFISAVAGCGFDVLVNANNHIYDRKADGIDKTLQKLDQYGLSHTGAYSTGQERAPLIVNVKGVNIAILAYTNFLNNHPKNVNMVDIYSEKQLKADISAVEAAGADFIMVYVHWGAEGTHKVNKSQKKEAAFIANAGADIILGSHPHCTQGTQMIKTAHGSVPVFYSLGNLVSSMGPTINKDSVMVNFVLEKDQETGKTYIAELGYTPTLCATTSAGRFVALPADILSIGQSSQAKALNSSRARTIKVLTDKVAKPE